MSDSTKLMAQIFDSNHTVIYINNLSNEYPNLTAHFIANSLILPRNSSHLLDKITTTLVNRPGCVMKIKCHERM
jgi:hypothetical protein